MESTLKPLFKTKLRKAVCLFLLIVGLCWIATYAWGVGHVRTAMISRYVTEFSWNKVTKVCRRALAPTENHQRLLSIASRMDLRSSSLRSFSRLS